MCFSILTISFAAFGIFTAFATHDIFAVFVITHGLPCFLCYPQFCLAVFFPTVFFWFRLLTVFFNVFGTQSLFADFVTHGCFAVLSVTAPGLFAASVALIVFAVVFVFVAVVCYPQFVAAVLSQSLFCGACFCCFVFHVYFYLFF